VTVFVKCIACRKSRPFGVYVTADSSEWERYPDGWLLITRNGVILPACSEDCADAHIESFGNKRVSALPGGVMRP
jgi:hypothetical protein